MSASLRMSSAMSPAKRSAVLYISAAHAASSALLPGPARHRGRGHESLVALEAGRALRSDSGVPSAGEDEETEEDAAGLDCTDEEAGVGAGSHRRNELGRGPNVCAISMSSTASNFVSCKLQVRSLTTCCLAAELRPRTFQLSIVQALSFIAKLYNNFIRPWPKSRHYGCLKAVYSRQT
jgi:hypothetical protein